MGWQKCSLLAETVSAQILLPWQVTTDYLDRLRQMKARMTGIKTRVETVRISTKSSASMPVTV